MNDPAGVFVSLGTEAMCLPPSSVSFGLKGLAATFSTEGEKAFGCVHSGDQPSLGGRGTARNERWMRDL